MRISDWSSDVCSSDLGRDLHTSGAAISSANDYADVVPGFIPGTHWRQCVVMSRDICFLTGRRRWKLPIDAILNGQGRSEEHTSELQSLMRISYAVFCLKKQRIHTSKTNSESQQQRDHN